MAKIKDLIDLPSNKRSTALIPMSQDSTDTDPGAKLTISQLSDALLAENSNLQNTHSVPTFATGTAYSIDDIFVDSGSLYVVDSEIASANTDDVDALEADAIITKITAAKLIAFRKRNQYGIVPIGNNYIQITQWRRGAGVPADPPAATYNPFDDSYDDFPAANWATDIPSGAATLWLSTAAITRDSNGDWQDSNSPVVMGASSVSIVFFDGSTRSWGNTPNEHSTSMRIWTASAGWQIRPINSRNLLCEGAARTAMTITPPQIDLTEIESLRLEIFQGEWRFASELPMDLIIDSIPDIDTVTNLSARNAATLSGIWGRTGKSQLIGSGTNNNLTLQSTDGGMTINLFRTQNHELARIRIVGTFGWASTSAAAPTFRLRAMY